MNCKMKSLVPWSLLVGCLLLFTRGASSDFTDIKDGRLVAYVWSSVPIGGGVATGLYPLDKRHAYARTASGGVFSWDADKSVWASITSSFPVEWQGQENINAFAVDPANKRNMFVVCGAYTADWWHGDAMLLKTTNSGSTWSQVNPPGWNVAAGSREASGLYGERLAVDPADSTVVLYGSNRNGMWRSTDAGDSWFPVPALAAAEANSYGITSIIFDRGIEGRVYAAVWDDGIYQSDDHGRSWSKLNGSPARACRLELSNFGDLWVAGDNALAKWKDGAWSSYAPAGSGAHYNGIAVHPARGNLVLALAGGDQGTAGRLYYSKDGGANWKQVDHPVHCACSWMDDAFQSGPLLDVEFDGGTTGRVWLATSTGVLRTDDLDGVPLTWTPAEAGLESTTAVALDAAPNAALLTGTLGIGGFRQDQGVEAYPKQRITAGGQDVPAGLDITGFAHSAPLAARQPPEIQLACGGRPGAPPLGYLASSIDGGVTWNQAPLPDGASIPLRVAAAAKDIKNWVMSKSDGTAAYTLDSGASWKPADGLPPLCTTPIHAPVSGPLPQWLVADPVRDRTFYAYAGAHLYRSDDGGATFQKACAAAFDVTPGDAGILCTAGGQSGELWLSLGGNGLGHFTDGGATWNSVATVTRADLLAIGAPAPDKRRPTLYIQGQVMQRYGTFRSIDDGLNWEWCHDTDHEFIYKTAALIASPDRYGELFAATIGHGVWKAAPFVAAEMAIHDNPGHNLNKASVTVSGGLGLPPGKIDGGGGGKPPECPWGVNLIANPGAQDGPGSPDGSVVLPVPLWFTHGNFTVMGAEGGPAPRFFVGGPNNSLSGASQEFAVMPPCYPVIDAGAGLFKLNGLLGGVGKFNDNAVVMVTFWKVVIDPQTGQSERVKVKERHIGPVFAAQRAFRTGALYRQFTGHIPKLTRFIDFDQIMTRIDGQYNNGDADDLSFVMGVEDGPVQTDEDALPDPNNPIQGGGGPNPPPQVNQLPH